MRPVSTRLSASLGFRLKCAGAMAIYRAALIIPRVQNFLSSISDDWRDYAKCMVAMLAGCALLGVGCLWLVGLALPA